MDENVQVIAVPVFQKAFPEWFGTSLLSMLTMFQICTGSDWMIQVSASRTFCHDPAAIWLALVVVVDVVVVDDDDADSESSDPDPDDPDYDPYPCPDPFPHPYPHPYPYPRPDPCSYPDPEDDVLTCVGRVVRRALQIVRPVLLSDDLSSAIARGFASCFFLSYVLIVSLVLQPRMICS